MADRMACRHNDDRGLSWLEHRALCFHASLLGLGIFLPLALALPTSAQPVQQTDTLPPLANGRAPADFDAMWRGFDPRAEPLEIETLHQWEEEGVVLRIVRFRIGVFQGKPARLAAIYGFPKQSAEQGQPLPGLLQIHGGGQYADHKACLANAKRGYATLSIAWAGRISAPPYRVGPNEVRLFWEKRTDDPHYRLTTDWGAVDGYHAPSRNPQNNFPGLKTYPWTLDRVDSPRNSPWFLCALAARRGLTFLEQQVEVDPDRLGVYGHSMGGKLTVMTAVDPRVKAAAPSCGGISDRDNDSPLFRQTVGDDVSLQRVTCPIIFLSPANDFHGRIGDLPAAIEEIKTDQWRVTCAPHHNHQDTAPYSVATLLWFDQHLKQISELPATPGCHLQLKTADGTPTFSVTPDSSQPIRSVDIYYTQQGKMKETRFDRELTMNRHWRYAPATRSDKTWTARLPLSNLDQPLWVYANVQYDLPQPVEGAGYYYGPYRAESFNLSSLLQKVSADQLKQSSIQPVSERSLLIDNFQGNWRKEWFSYRPDQWPISTHKLFDSRYRAPTGATLSLEVKTAEANPLVVLLEPYAAVIDLQGSEHWQEIELNLADFKNFSGQSLLRWEQVRRLKLSDVERLRSTERGSRESKMVGRRWQGTPPEFRALRWLPADTPAASK
ncbi:MAG: dienelactone hydrolase family protein [Mariniblastus sp.]|nr:dienelactone hydrolase family protein [Mariniblastus sp.]